MATRLDQQIEQLGIIVEKCLNLCRAMWQGIGCTLPANHASTDPHEFPAQFLQTQPGTGAAEPLQTDCAGRDQLNGQDHQQL
jgi:hypothetical protein